MAAHLIKRFPASKLHVSKPTHWLESRFHFSFADWYSPDRENFGVLRVLNDDLVTPEDGFGTHPHRNMEIVSYIVKGELSHNHRGVDGSRASESLGRGAVQYMSAGVGIQHSEMNNHPTETVRFLQIWIVPDASGHKTNYGSKVFSLADRHNKLLRIVSGQVGVRDFAPSSDASIPIHQDANIFVSELDKDVSVSLPLDSSRQTYFVCIEGSVELTIDGETTVLTERDGAEIKGAAGAALGIKALVPGAHILAIEMAKS